MKQAYRSLALITMVLVLSDAASAQWIKVAPKEVVVKKITPLKKKTVSPKEKEGPVAGNRKEIKEIEKQEVLEEDPGVEVVVREDGKDKTYVMKRKYDNTQFLFSEGLAPAEYEGKYGFVNERFEEVVAPKYRFARDFNEGMAAVCNDQYKWTFINTKGKELTPLKYDEAFFFFDDMALVTVNNKWGYINKTGKEVIPVQFVDASAFSEGLAWTSNNGRSTFIDKSGNEVLSVPYIKAKVFEEGLAAVKNSKGKWGFINKRGEEVIPCQFTEVKKNFREGSAEVETEYETIRVSSNSYYKRANIIAIDKKGNTIKNIGTTSTSIKRDK